MPEVQTPPNGTQVPVLKASAKRLVTEAFTNLSFVIGLTYLFMNTVNTTVLMFFPNLKWWILSLSVITGLYTVCAKIASIWHIKLVSFNEVKEDGNVTAQDGQ